MRRLLFGRRFLRQRVGLTSAIVIALTPGLLSMQAGFATADSGGFVTRVNGDPTTPVQQSGTAAGLPSLVPC